MVLEEGLHILFAPFIQEISGPFNFIGIEAWPLQKCFTLDPEKVVINVMGDDEHLHTYEIDTIIHARLDYTLGDIPSLLALKEENNKSLCGVIKNHIETVIYNSKKEEEFIKKPTQLQPLLNFGEYMDILNEEVRRWHIKIDNIIIESCVPSQLTEEHFRKKIHIQQKYEQDKLERDREMSAIDHQIELVKKQGILEEEKVKASHEYVLKCIMDKHDGARLTKLVKDYGIEYLGEVGKMVRVLRNGKCYIPDSVTHIGVIAGQI